MPQAAEAVTTDYSAFQDIVDNLGIDPKALLKELITETAKEAASSFGESVGETTAKALLERYFKESLPVIGSNGSSGRSNNVRVPRVVFNSMSHLPSYCECEKSATDIHLCHECDKPNPTPSRESKISLYGGRKQTRRTFRQRRGKTNRTRFRHK